MKRISINIDKISQFDLKLARNPRVITLAQEIAKQTLDERQRQLNELQESLQAGRASLFEERVHSKLLDKRKAEWILLLHKNLPVIEEEFRKRRHIQELPVKEPLEKPVDVEKDSMKEIRQSHSELLDFLATQKPPTPSPSPSRKTILSAPENRSTHHTRDITVGALLLLGVVLSVGYVLSSEKDEPHMLTFHEQAQEQSHEQRLAEEFDREIQEQFDAAAQEIRSGEFDIGKTQLLELSTTYPESLHAENAYILIADTYRLRKTDPDEALKYYQRLLDTYPESRQVGLTQLKMGFSYEDIGDTSNAQAIYHLILERYGEKSRLGQLARERLLRLES